MGLLEAGFWGIGGLSLLGSRKERVSEKPSYTALLMENPLLFPRDDGTFVV